MTPAEVRSLTACPRCRASIGTRCRSLRGPFGPPWVSNHKAREDAAGKPGPVPGTVGWTIEQLQKFPPGTSVLVYDGWGEHARIDAVEGDVHAVYIYP